MISINNGTIFVDGKRITNPELIGYAMLDFAETLQNDGIVITLKEANVFVENTGECIYENETTNISKPN